MTGPLEEPMTEKPSAWQKYSLIALTAASLWLLAGALAKLFMGTPADMPPPVRDFVRAYLPFGIDTAFRVVIAIELCTVLLCWLKPRLGWMLISATYVVFLAILVDLVRQGAESCGCGGAKIKIHPAVMLAIDGTLFAALLATRPWKSITTKGAPFVLVPVTWALAIAAPIFLIKSSVAPPQPVASTGNGDVPAEWKAPDPSEISYFVFEPEKWVDKAIWDTDLAIWIDPETLPMDGQIVFYRLDCDHCARHMIDLANNPTGLPLCLIRVWQKSEGDPAIGIWPEGDVTKLELPPGVDYVIETPFELEVMGGTVTAARKIEN